MWRRRRRRIRRRRRKRRRTSEEDKDEEDSKDFLDPEGELFMKYKRDRNNTPFCKLVPANASDLKLDHFMGQSTKRK